MKTVVVKADFKAWILLASAIGLEIYAGLIFHFKLSTQIAHIIIPNISSYIQNIIEAIKV